MLARGSPTFSPLVFRGVDLRSLLEFRESVSVAEIHSAGDRRTRIFIILYSRYGTVQAIFMDRSIQCVSKHQSPFQLSRGV